ncbi:MAG TPA: hypothetical protein VE998_10850, partial [Terriglobales bacterium]|nr:hypothetical protein [Terriglobales bacterium]
MRARDEQTGWHPGVLAMLAGEQRGFPAGELVTPPGGRQLLYCEFAVQAPAPAWVASGGGVATAERESSRALARQALEFY